jgi:fumarate hydratase class I
VTAAGPTTSIREEPYQAEIIRKFGLRGVIGKGGMGERTLAACKECGCVYLHAIGGAAQVLAECVKKVRHVYLLEKFGSPEAIWELEIENFPAVVTMDAHGGSLHKEILAASQAALASRV